MACGARVAARAVAHLPAPARLAAATRQPLISVGSSRRVPIPGVAVTGRDVSYVQSPVRVKRLPQTSPGLEPLLLVL